MQLLNRSSSFTYVAIALMAVTGAALVLYLTRFGPGAGGDSTAYLMGAENLLNGNGFSRYSGGYEIRPITGFPPFYSVTLAMVGALDVPLFQASRWLNALIFAANISLVGGMVFWLTRSFVAPVLAGLLFLARTTQLELHAWVMSEPLFVLLSLVVICLLGLYFDRQRTRWLIAAAAVTVLATLTRYVGAALIGAGVIGILAFGPLRLSRRIREVAIFAGLSAIPVYMWLLRNRAVGGTLVNREVNYHPMEPDLIRLFMADISSWFVPHAVPLPMMVRAALAIFIAGGVLLGLMITLSRTWMKWDRTRFEITGPRPVLSSVPWLLVLYTAGNLAILWVNSTWLDAATTAAAPPRYLAPVFVTTLILFSIVVAHVVGRPGAPRVASKLVTGYALVLFAFFAAGSLVMVRDPLPNLGYTGRKYMWPEVVDHLERIPEKVPIISNNPEMIYILAGRPAYVRPISFDPYRGELREDYQKQFAQLETQLASGAVFVVFDEIEADDQEVIERFNLQLLGEYPAARIYGQSQYSELEIGAVVVDPVAL